MFRVRQNLLKAVDYLELNLNFKLTGLDGAAAQGFRLYLRVVELLTAA